MRDEGWMGIRRQGRAGGRCFGWRHFSCSFSRLGTPLPACTGVRSVFCCISERCQSFLLLIDC